MSDAPQVAYTQGALEAYPVHHQQEDKIHKQDVQPYFADTTQSTPQVPPETILGLRRRNFWILFAVIVLVVCATIGGSVGGSLAVQKSNSNPEPSHSTPISTNVSTPSATSSGPIVPNPSTVDTIPISCPNPPQLSAYNRQPYNCTESRNIVSQGDIMGIVAYTLQTCIDACSTMNQLQGSTKCKAVIIGTNMSKDYKDNKGANCWLKSTAEFKLQQWFSGTTLLQVQG